MSYASFQSRYERHGFFPSLSLHKGRLLGDVERYDSRSYLDIVANRQSTSAAHAPQGWAALCFLKVLYLTWSSRTGARQTEGNRSRLNES